MEDRSAGDGPSLPVHHTPFRADQPPQGEHNLKVIVGAWVDGPAAPHLVALGLSRETEVTA